MQYKFFQGMSVSTLGMGNMRLPTTKDHGPIDQKKAREIIEYSYEHGINYFDTAYRYHGGESEPFVGEVLSQYPRESYYLATKLPGHMMNYEDGKLGVQGYLSDLTLDSASQIFEDQLERCKVDYFDFYLLHNVCETAYDFYTNKELALVDYLLEQKKAGRIHHLGFSAHAHANTLDKFLNWRDCFEFVQIQLNYLDWTLQDAKRKYEIVTSHGIPVIVMEPVRGGKLANLGEKNNALLKAVRPDDSIASWAFSFLQSLPNIQVVLSGMTTLDQVKENIEIFSNPNPTNEEEKILLQQIVDTMFDQVPCTACEYCLEACPQNMNIPGLISMYDEARSLDHPFLLRYALGAMKPEELPSACLQCGDCDKLCPQGIDIPDIINKFDKLVQ
ncbi:MAG: aldo/keto reductase, partial [Desulfobacterales bacterium]|nr:aldo/keto reductase [Desulfobacterales bacterium]